MSYTEPVPGGLVERTDQGVDISAPPGTPIRAIATEQAVGIIPNWYAGQPFEWFKQLGTNVYNYVAEQVTNLVPVGTVVQQGQQVGTVAQSGTGLELGFATASGQTLARATTGYTEGQATPAGQQYSQQVIGYKQGQVIPKNVGVGPGTGGAASTPTGQIVQQAAARYSIPPQILWGVFGMETSYGANVTTSSAGAKGAFQFIQATAKTYNYPWNNNTDTATFTAQANAAANYLADLFAQKGTWDAALRAYSGGGYGLAQVQNKGASFSSSATSAAYGGTRPGGEPSGSTTSTSVDNVFADYLALRDTPRTAPPGTKNPWQWFQASFTGNWDAVTSGASSTNVITDTTGSSGT